MKNAPRFAAPSPLLRVAVQRGFTLIELMVVIALIGIASVMILPEMKGSYQDAILRANCRELVDTFQLAYSRAVSLNQAHRVRIDEGSGRYVIESAQGDASRKPEFHALQGVPGCQGKLDSRIKVQLRAGGESPEDAAAPQSRAPEQPFSPENLIFYADGTATSCEVLLSDEAGFGLVMAVNPVTGRVKIGEIHRK